MFLINNFYLYLGNILPFFSWNTEKNCGTNFGRRKIKNLQPVHDDGDERPFNT